MQDNTTERFGLFGKLVAKPGQRDALAEILLEAAGGEMPGCELYVVNVAASDPDAVWVFEVWRGEADHKASLKLESVRELIAKARPLIAGAGENVRLTVLGGKGLPPK